MKKKKALITGISGQNGTFFSGLKKKKFHFIHFLIIIYLKKKT